MALNSAQDTVLRQWQMLRHLPREPRGVTVGELTAKLIQDGIPVSRRTIERDLLHLSANFPLIVDDSARPHLWSWKREGTSMTVPGLTAAEAVAFSLVRRFLSPLLPTSIVDELAPYFDEARRRTGATPGRPWEQKVRSLPAAQVLMAPCIDADIQATLFEALSLERRVRVTYRPREEATVRRYSLSPLGIVQRGPLIYLLGRVDEYEDVLSFALHRFVHAEITSEHVDASDFDLDVHLANGFLASGRGRSTKMKLRFLNEAALHLKETPLAEDQTMVPDGGDHKIVSASVRETPELVWWIRGFGLNVEVVSPKRLAIRVAGD